MALNSYFIGINKYLDSQIFDLSGASNDAKALWALFTDTIPDIQAHLFVDEQANVESVKNVFESVLSKASVDDSVIITFAGHGTPDHRLVCYNTIKDDCPSTSISAEEIANYFRKSKAKTIILILDCCFSGGAPARVLSDVSLPRNTCYTMQSIAGEGRVIIAASNYNEPAWEQPASGHGLLTKALIDILQDGNDNIDFMSATSEILKHVAAEAQRIGQVQTPVVLGSITGGLFIPVLKPGENYKALFPDIAATKISENIAELTKFGVPSEVTDVWADRFKHGLNDLQQNAVNEYRVLNGESLLVVAPTSSGKTFIGEMASMCAHIQGRKPYSFFHIERLQMRSMNNLALCMVHHLTLESLDVQETTQIRLDHLCQANMKLHF